MLDRGYRLIQLRSKNLSETALFELAEAAREISRNTRVLLMLNGPAHIVEGLDLGGVHLDSQSLMACETRPISDQYWLAASCHNQEELKQANRIGADFVCLSPLNNTASHPEIQPLGALDFSRLCCTTNLPVFALGGLGPSDVAYVRELGAQGVAGISNFWG